MNKIRVNGQRKDSGTIFISGLSKYRKLFPTCFSMELDLDTIQQREKGIKKCQKKIH